MRPDPGRFRCIQMAGGGDVQACVASGPSASANSPASLLGEKERMSVLPLFPMDVTDEIQLIRIALATDDTELAEHAVGTFRTVRG